MTQDQINKKLEVKTRQKPVFIKASEVKALTIWDTKDKMYSARCNGNLTMIKMKGKIFYNLNQIDSRFLKPKA